MKKNQNNPLRKTVTASLLIAVAGVGAASSAAAAPAQGTTGVGPYSASDANNTPSDAPSRPGAKTHYSRGSTKLGKAETDDTALGAESRDDTLRDAGITP